MRIHKGVSYNGRGEVMSCLFCNIMQRTEPATIISENDRFVAFKTIAPVSSYHILICPREHIQNVTSLTMKDKDLLQELWDFGRRTMGPELSEDALFCFHRSPWNSIDHLHLHGIANPHTRGVLGRLKYTAGAPWCVSVQAAMKELDKDRPWF